MDCKLWSENEYLQVVNDLLNGQVVGFPTDTVYGLAIVYDNQVAFNQLYEIKKRSIHKPISMMVSSIDEIKTVAEVDSQTEKVIQKFMPGALTIILKAKGNLPSHVTFNYQTIGIRIPTNDVALKILKAIKKPLLVTSANISSEPSLLKYQDVYERFHQHLSSLVTSDALGCMASSVVSMVNGKLQMLRQGPIKEEEILKFLEENKMKKVAIACDHGGVELKNAIMEHLKNTYEFVDFGTNTLQSCDYPIFAFKAGESVAKKECDFGILICKSGIGMSIAANKVKGIRCALIQDVNNAKLCHQHNHANMIAMGANDVSLPLALKIIAAYDSVEFESRHQHRLDLISEYENK